MTERLRASTAALEVPSDEDIRRRLEGRGELIERARRHYALLEGVLTRGDWRRELTARRALVGEVVEEQADLVDALEQARRRARAEGWPEHTPVLVAARELEKTRERLQGLAFQRLAAVTAVSGPPELGRDLRKLAVLAAERVYWGTEPEALFRPQAGKPDGSARFLGTRHPRLCLTSERLIAVADGRDEPIELGWSSLAGQGPSVDLQAGTLALGEAGTVRLEGQPPEALTRLALLIELLRHPSMRQLVLDSPGGEVDWVCFPAVHERDMRRQRGHAVLMKHGLFFLRDDAGPQLLRLVPGTELAREVPLPGVLDVLRGLSERHLIPLRERARASEEGMLRTASNARFLFSGSPLLSTELCILSETDEVRGRLSGRQKAQARRLLSGWMPLRLPKVDFQLVRERLQEPLTRAVDAFLGGKRTGEHRRVMGPVPMPEDVRRQLEGGLNLIQETSRHHEALQGTLRGGDWLRRLREHPRLVTEVLERDAAFLDALERVTRQAEGAGLPKDAPAVKTVRRARELRVRLDARVHALLARLTPVPMGASLEKSLRRLDALVREPVPPQGEPGEVFLKQMGGASHLPAYSAALHLMLLMSLMAVPCFLMGVVFPFRMLWDEGSVWPLAVLGWVSLVLLMASMPKAGGSVWLSPKRLVQVLPGSEVIAVRLDSIPDGGIVLNSMGDELQVQGDRRIQMRLPPYNAGRLYVWLELLRHPELRARMSFDEPLAEPVGFPAFLRRGTGLERGQAVLTPRMLFFIPGTQAEAGTALLKAATGRPQDSRAELSWALEVLRWQPEADLEAYLLQAVNASRGVAWPAGKARPSGDVLQGGEVHISHDAESITGRFGSGQVAAANRTLAAWR